MVKAYPAIFHYEENGYWVEFPDLPGCLSEGDDAAQALAQRAVSASPESGGAGELQSQSVGSWSKTYRSGGDSAQQAMASAKAASDGLAAVARQYLAGTGLLYRGTAFGCSPDNQSS